MQSGDRANRFGLLGLFVSLSATIAAIAMMPSGRASTFFIEGSRRQFSNQSNVGLDATSVKSGLSTKLKNLTAWGEFERFGPDNYSSANYFEMAGQYAFTKTNLTMAYGQSDDFRFKPSRLILTEIQFPLAKYSITPYIGASQEMYDAPIRNTFQYYKVGIVKNFSQGIGLLLQYQFIDNQNEDKTINKIGSQISTTVSYIHENNLYQLGTQFSCTSSRMDCSQQINRDEYSETNFIYRWWSHPSKKDWGVRGQFSYIYQKSYFIKETETTISSSSFAIKVGPQFEF